MTEFTFQLLLVGVPGIVGYFLIRRWTGAPIAGEEKFVTILQILCISVASYLLYALFDAVKNLIATDKFSSDVFTHTLRDVSTAGSADIVYATIASIVIAALWTASVRKDWFNKAARTIGIARTFGHHDTWDYFHNLPRSEKNGGWIVVRDLKGGFVYFGHVIAWSEWGGERELIISRAEVRRADGKLLGELDKVYLCRKSEEITIEVPPSAAADKPKGKTTP